MQVSTVPFSKIQKASNLFRFDAEYFQPKYLETENLIKKSKYYELRDLISVLTDYHANGSYEVLRGNVRLKSEEDYAHMIRTVDIERDDFENDIIYISESAYNFLTKTKVYGGEIIINKIGNAGRVYLIPPVSRPTSLGMNQFMIRANSGIDNHYLFCYLSGKYGQNQLNQRITGAVPLSIDKESTKSVFVPIFSKTFQKLVSKTIELHFEYSEVAKNLYKQAKFILLSELGLSNWQSKHQLTFVKNHSDTKSAERIDAEYFQPKYGDIIKAIQGYSGGWERLENLATLNDENFNPQDEKEYKYIELANIAGNGEITDCMVEEGQNLPTRARRKVATGDVIVSSIEGSLSSIALIKEEYNQALCSTGFHVINSNVLNSETLLVLLKSLVGQLQLKKGCSGTILTAINRNEFGKVILPLVPQDKQTEIQQKVTESFELRKRSKHLLECAKQAVEIAIEQDEQMAINWLEAATQ